MTLIRKTTRPGSMCTEKLKTDCNCPCHSGKLAMIHFRACCEQNPKYDISFPEVDEFGTPTKKLPNCPHCDEDELGVIHLRLMMCYNCGWKMELVEEKV